MLVFDSGAKFTCQCVNAMCVCVCVCVGVGVCVCVLRKGVSDVKIKCF